MISLCTLQVTFLTLVAVLLIEAHTQGSASSVDPGALASADIWRALPMPSEFQETESNGRLIERTSTEPLSA